MTAEDDAGLKINRMQNIINFEKRSFTIKG